MLRLNDAYHEDIVVNVTVGELEGEWAQGDVWAVQFKQYISIYLQQSVIVC